MPHHLVHSHLTSFPTRRSSDLEEEHLISLTKHIIAFKGDFVKKGQQLTEGPIVPHEILEVCGPQELQEHLVNEVQEVYRDRKSTRLNSSHRCISYAVFCLKKKT